MGIVGSRDIPVLSRFQDRDNRDKGSRGKSMGLFGQKILSLFPLSAALDSPDDNALGK